MVKTEISEDALKDKLFQSRFGVAKTADAAPEHAALGFSSWCGLELMAASLAGMDMKSGSVDLDARMPPSAEAASMWVPADPVPAPVLEGWGPEGQHSVDAAQTFVVALLASLRTVEMMRSEIRDRRLRANGSVIIIGFCAGGKSTTAADRQPFFWYVDSFMGVTGTTNLWLWDWAGSRVNTGYMFPTYTLPHKAKHVGAPWKRACKDDWVVAGTWNRLLGLSPISLSNRGRLAARSTPYSTQSCMPSLARALNPTMPGLSVLDRTRLGRWSRLDRHESTLCIVCGKYSITRFKVC